ncbi:MAG TPA: DUF6602 domain-containing protein [Chloroflexota bacterium]|nr:DUF6602 domain-containing protein [Chloroflexota bacterium]
MIRSVADFLDQLKDAEVRRLDAVDVRHGPTIGDMYEGLSADLLRRAIPEQLELQIVAGFVTDGLGNQSQQVDCMLVRGSGDRIPYTESYVWPVKDVLAVFEVKKSLYRDDLIDAYEKLRRIKELHHGYWSSQAGKPGVVDIGPALRAFAETTRRIAPPYDDLDSLPLTEQLVFHTLVGEHLCPVGIVLGFHGYASEKAFRDSLLAHLAEQINVPGYGPGSFPQLMISGKYSLGKANGQPYSARMHEGWWPFYFSTRVKPILLLLEYVWTRLNQEIGIGGLWGEDLSLERLSPFLITQAAASEAGRVGWRYEAVALDESQLESGEEFEPWEPEFVSIHEFVALTRLCDGHRVVLNDPDLLRYLADAQVDPQDLRERLLDTGLVALAGDEIELITERCQTAVLPDGRYVAGENNTGRLSRWLERYLESRSDAPST